MSECLATDSVVADTASVAVWAGKAQETMLESPVLTAHQQFYARVTEMVFCEISLEYVGLCRNIVVRCLWAPVTLLCKIRKMLRWSFGGYDFKAQGGEERFAGIHIRNEYKKIEDGRYIP